MANQNLKDMEKMKPALLYVMLLLAAFIIPFTIFVSMVGMQWAFILGMIFVTFTVWSFSQKNFARE